MMTKMAASLVPDLEGKATIGYSTRHVKLCEDTITTRIAGMLLGTLHGGSAEKDSSTDDDFTKVDILVIVPCQLL